MRNDVIIIFLGVLFLVYHDYIEIQTKNETEAEKDIYRGLYGLRDDGYDLLIVGSGLSGSVIAFEASQRLGLRSLVIDKRNHIGGNCYDYIDKHGIRVSKYGAHIFHTKSDRVWEYVNKLTEWMRYEHRVKGMVADENGILRLVPIPPNQDTVNILFKTNITNEVAMNEWLNNYRPNLKGNSPKNGEEMSLSRVGSKLYEKIFKYYTKKQWNKYPAELDASVLARLPFRLNNDDRYFTDPYQALPKDGYTQLFKKMLLNVANIDVRLNLDYFEVKDKLPKYKYLVFTGPIDSYYASAGMKKLEYRSIYFEKEYHEPKGGYYQASWMVNHPGSETNWTRITEYKHMPNQPDGIKERPGTVIYKEYSTDIGDPYYPVPNERNHELYAKYQALSSQEKDIIFVGRLATYKYFNMDEAILNALETFDKYIVGNILLTPAR